MTRCAIALLLLVLGAPAAAQPLAREDVPAPLQPWVDWVLAGQDLRRCPFLYRAPDTHRCAWPARLALDVYEDVGRFTQGWLMLAPGEVPLPGEPGRWPQLVTVDGEPAVVASRDGAPQVRLSAGWHAVGGFFDWDALPESLQLPPGSGLVALRLNGARVGFPDIDGDGRLWLRERGAARGAREGVRNTLEARVFRDVIDEIPLRVVTRVELDVSGEPREVVLGPALLPDYLPLALRSPLPARVEPDGRLRVQVRPGSWSIELEARHPGPVTAIPLAAGEPPWPDSEVWVFDARPQLRLVSIEGVPSIDPRQTSLPPPWQRLPAYRLEPGDTLRMEVKRRGDPEPEPDRLALERTLWLDFDGGGYTVQDRISGELNRGWRLEVEPPLALGRVAVDGEPRLITRRGGAGREGVELRRGALRMVAESRIGDRRGALPAAGWAHGFQKLEAQLELPPGWRLLHASGADRVQHTWLNRWTLLDLFVVLVIAAAVRRLLGWRWGLVALAGTALAWHQPGAPTWVWLFVLAGVALLRVLPEGGLRRLLRLYQGLALVALAVILVPFAVDQVRVAIFPQLEHPGGTPQPLSVAGGVARDEAAPAPELPGRKLLERAAPAQMAPQLALAPPPAGAPQPQEEGSPLARFDPEARIQTGPGVPRWHWRGVRLEWSGPVEPGQSLRLWLVAPPANLVLRLLCVALLVLLALRLALPRGWRPPRAGARAVLAGLAVLGAAGGVPVPARAEIPPPPMLEELRERLLAAPQCAPECAQSPRMRIEIAGDRLRARMEVHAQAEVGVPLPGSAGQWQPQRVLLEGEPGYGVYRDGEGRLWLRVPAGRHQILLEGALPARDRVQIELPLKPQRVEATAEGWRISGLHENGVADDRLQLTRSGPGAAQAEAPALEPRALPPLLRVERTLALGLEWQVHTRVERLSPPGAAVVMEIPLLEGESVTSAGTRVEHGRVLLNMAPGQREARWQSVLGKRDRIVLEAPRTSGWTELWRLDASPIWHVETAGIPVVGHQAQGRWMPQWRPWPGERVSLAVTRPEGVAGRTLTVDATRLELDPGRRTRDVQLGIDWRSSQGGQHAIRLPEGARLQSVHVDGSARPIRQDGRRVVLPLTPGSQHIELLWREDRGLRGWLRSPAVDLGIASVNATLQMQVPASRWVLLTGGPRLGPAVLFWGVLAVIVLAALALGRTRRAPLRTWQWLLLGIGLSQIPVWGALLVVAWFFALEARGRRHPDLRRWQFNLAQAGLFLWTLAVLAVLLWAVQQGLLGTPDMQIAGNDSSARHLQWFQDRAPALLPRAWVISVPLPVYRFLMLGWALWLAFSLLRWLRWGWSCYAAGGVWRRVRLSLPRRRREPDPPGGG